MVAATLVQPGAYIAQTTGGAILGMQVPKTTDVLEIQFPHAFSRPPIVLASGFWPRGGGYMLDHADAVADVTTTGCTVKSRNKAAAGDCFVNILALDQRLLQLGGLWMDAGSVQKTAATVKVNLRTRAHREPPVVLLSPVFPRNVDAVEGVKVVAATHFIASGNNYGPVGHALNYLALDRGIGIENGHCLMAGITKQPASTHQRIYFDTPYDHPPVVTVTPVDDNPFHEHGVLTISAITREYYELHAKEVDASAPCSIAWAAFGPLKGCPGL
jgi:hypothetical protein